MQVDSVIHACRSQSLVDILSNCDLAFAVPITHQEIIIIITYVSAYTNSKYLEMVIKLKEY